MIYRRFYLSLILCLSLSAAHAQMFPGARAPEKIQSRFPFDIDLADVDSNVVNSAQLLRGDKPTVLMFWMTTCGPCRMELEAISSKYEAWQKETPFKMVAICMDFPDWRDKFVKRVKSENWPFAALHDFRREFPEIMPGNLNGLPQIFVYDKNGKISYQTRKYVPGDEDVLFSKIKETALVK